MLPAIRETAGDVVWWPPGSNLTPCGVVICISLLLILELFQADVTFQSIFPGAVRNHGLAAETEGVSAGGPSELWSHTPDGESLVSPLCTGDWGRMPVPLWWMKPRWRPLWETEQEGKGKPYCTCLPISNKNIPKTFAPHLLYQSTKQGTPKRLKLPLGFSCSGRKS